MPTNLPPQAREAEARYKAARTVEEKIAALEEFLALMPKHKGTDKLQADVKSRLAKLRQEPSRRGGTHGTSHIIPREGAGQVALVGPPNSGKSSLVARLTHAEPKIADYPFTTREPVPGMMRFEDVSIQLIDLPALSAEHAEPWVFDLIRRADLLWFVLAPENALEDFETVGALLRSHHLPFVPSHEGPAHHDADGHRILKSLLVLTGMDRPDNAENAALLKELLPGNWPIAAVSVVAGSGLDDVARMTYEALDVIRVYSKEPGKPPDRQSPFTVSRGSTVADLALRIHKDLAHNLRFARVWGSGAFDGQQVNGDHVLADRDVVEIHA